MPAGPDATDDEREVDAAIAERLAGGSDAAWNELWSALDDVEQAATAATWAGGEPIGTVMVGGEERPVVQMPYAVNSPAVERLVDAILGLDLVVPFDWMSWRGVERYRGGTRLADAPVEDAVRLITAIVRGERFCEGNINDAVEDGTLPAAVARLRSWKAAAGA